MEERNDINKYRASKKRNKFALKTLVFLLIVLIFVLAAANWKTLFAPFKNIGLKLGEGGFPVTLPGSAGYVLGELGENFYLLTDTYLYTYNGAGAEITGIQHSFQNPACTSNSKRVMVYDKNGKDFKTFSRSSEMYAGTVDDSIVFARMGNNERSAVVTTSSRYSNLLYIFNSEGKWIFRWASPNEKIMQVCFGSGDNSFYVSVVGEKNGELQVSVLRFDISNTKSEVWRTFIGNDISYSLERCGDGIYAVTSSGAFLLNEQTGEISARNTFSRPVWGISETDGIRAVFFRDSGSNGEIAAVYNEKLEAAASVSPNDVKAFDVNGGRLYILGGSTLTSYDSSLKIIKTYDMDDEYSDVKIINGCAYLLGYNTVWRVEL